MKIYFIFGLVLFIIGRAEGQEVTTKPTFHVNFSASSPLETPTADKPQSKLWFMDSCWWALLSSSSGPTVWQRTNNGWKEHEEVNNSLKDIPGRADVWYENRAVTAVGVSESSLTIFRILPKKPKDSTNIDWKANVLSRLTMPPRRNIDIETATLAKDTHGVWWVAADVGDGIYVWGSKDAKHWSVPILIGENISVDDISSISALNHSIIVIWSDQRADAVFSREHTNGHPFDDWSAIHTIASGNNTADDHINTALSANGTLWVVTKNSVDKIHHPQLVLRVRKPEGQWKNYTYLKREQKKKQPLIPSRPVVITTPDPDLILSGYTVYDHTNKNRHDDRIVFGVMDTTSEGILVKRQEVIIPDISLKTNINNITGPKDIFPSGRPWIILASDNKGNIYEADLRRFFEE